MLAQRFLYAKLKEENIDSSKWNDKINRLVILPS